MREPSTTVPGVVVLDEVPVESKPKVVMDPKRDLWISTVDGRYQSPVIPVRCGPDEEIFWVHKDILRKSEWFRKALDGQFRESHDQTIDLPEENPVGFSFLISYLYEGTFQPIKPAYDALVAQQSKGKGKERETEVESSGTNSGTSSDSSISGSDNSARSALRARRSQRRREQEWNERNRKQPGQHRPDCNCATCTAAIRGISCFNCGMIRSGPPPRNRQPAWYPPYGGPPPPPPPGQFNYNRYMPAPPPPAHRRRRGAAPYVPEFVEEARMTEEDLRSWVMTYELSVDVYICADRYLMDEFKKCVARAIEDQLETAGIDAAEPRVLHCCKKLHDALPENDVLLRKVFARVGFMLSKLQQNFAAETQEFWMNNVEVGFMIMKETMERRGLDHGDMLPAMDRFSTSPNVTVTNTTRGMYVDKLLSWISAEYEPR